jgi:hypothetical protein
MRRNAWLLLTLAAVAAPSQAYAGEWFSWMRRDCRRNNCWPQPFNVPDRMAVRSPFEVMIRNGWQVQNTLSDEHFDPETGELIGAGELKARDILIEHPPGHRQIYVLRGKNPQDTANRQRSVAEFAQRVLHPGESPQISESYVRPRGWSAEYINNIGARYNASAPDPRLPSASGGGGVPSTDASTAR